MNKVFLIGLVGVWLNRSEKGFRQKDLRFYIELINDWLDSTQKNKQSKIQNTQIMRFLESLVLKDWLIKKIGPVYYFKNKNFMAFLKEVFRVEDEDPFEVFLLQVHSATLYSKIIYQLLNRRGIELSYGEKLDLEALLSAKSLIEIKRSSLLKEIKVLEKRIDEVDQMVQFSKSKINSMDPMEIAKELERINPYNLQFYQPMAKTFKDLIPEIAKLELTENSRKRINTLWIPILNDLKFKLNTLDQLNIVTSEG